MNSYELNNAKKRQKSYSTLDSLRSNTGSSTTTLQDQSFEDKIEIKHFLREASLAQRLKNNKVIPN